MPRRSQVQLEDEADVNRGVLNWGVLNRLGAEVSPNDGEALPWGARDVA